jgi:hypothetical protein
MALPIHIERPDVAADVQALAELSGLSVTDAVGRAVRTQLAIERDAKLAERLKEVDEIVDRFNRLPVVGPLLTDDDLYDEDGLPK